MKTSLCLSLNEYYIFINTKIQFLFAANKIFVQILQCNNKKIQMIDNQNINMKYKYYAYFFFLGENIASIRRPSIFGIDSSAP